MAKTQPARKEYPTDPRAILDHIEAELGKVYTEASATLQSARATIGKITELRAEMDRVYKAVVEKGADV